ncbi:helix-turn-helix domain-containing protein [Flavobacterium anhuiense]|uniref:helix-turn-helix domain-containing protein n=1 Tax=Flavobacterium anhuiense TaxID=459526 RepID=UPI00202688B7|nr:helix-turn-helix transcriptional regulator [Flavobacterium anhuiense]URM37197.1 helix-turn-helix domain-containing protein [Flavobacterium anhuiense]
MKKEIKNSKQHVTNIVDRRLLRLIDLLIYQNKISTLGNFSDIIGMKQQNISKIKKGETHFTVGHIENICHKFNVNANWIFGLEKKVFNMPGSVEITDF